MLRYLFLLIENICLKYKIKTLDKIRINNKELFHNKYTHIYKKFTF